MRFSKYPGHSGTGTWCGVGRMVGDLGDDPWALVDSFIEAPAPVEDVDAG